MRVAVDSLLKREDKTRYWLANEIGVTYQNLRNLCNNNTTAIKFEILENICFALHCTPNDILIIGQND